MTIITESMAAGRQPWHGVVAKVSYSDPSMREEK